MTPSSNFPVLGPIIIGTSDVAKAKLFYIAVFGIVVDRESENYVSARMIDGTRMELEEESENRFPQWAARNIGTYKNCEFHVADLILFLKNVVEHGGIVVSAPVIRPWGDVNAEFSDCDGNVFLVSQRTV
jgi:predicted enzyme related to lactoylglutathione lyase